MQEANDFEILKNALLSGFNVNAEDFRLKVRESTPEEMESSHQFIVRLESYLMKWLQLAAVGKTIERVIQLVLMEQFVSTCNIELDTFLKWRVCKDTTRAW